MVEAGGNHEWRIKRLEDDQRTRDDRWRTLMEEEIPKIKSDVRVNTLKVSLLTAAGMAVFSAIVQRFLP